MSRPRLSPVWLVLGAIASVQIGAAVAKTLFGTVDPTTMAWLRVMSGSVMLVAIARPRLSGRTAADWRIVIYYGLALVIMNWAIYQSFARIPLGIAVTIEFLGPLTLAALGSRRPRDLLWVLLAAVGVTLLGIEPGTVTWLGVAFALLAATGWAAYILASARTGATWPGLDGLAVASVLGAVVLTPYAVAVGGSDLRDPQVWAIGGLIGLLSSVIPYTLELVALRSIRPAVFSILMSLEPAAAALAAVVVLREVLTPLQLLAMACVVAASVGTTRSGSPLAEPVPD